MISRVPPKIGPPALGVGVSAVSRGSWGRRCSRGSFGFRLGSRGFRLGSRGFRLGGRGFRLGSRRGSRLNFLCIIVAATHGDEAGRPGRQCGAPRKEPSPPKPCSQCPHGVPLLDGLSTGLWTLRTYHIYHSGGGSSTASVNEFMLSSNATSQREPPARDSKLCRQRGERRRACLPGGEFTGAGPPSRLRCRRHVHLSARPAGAGRGCRAGRRRRGLPPRVRRTGRYPEPAPSTAG